MKVIIIQYLKSFTSASIIYQLIKANKANFKSNFIYRKKMTHPTSSTNTKCFDFLKEGHDKQFDSAMKSIDSMYDNLFNGDHLDKIFETLKYEDNPITEPIDDMTKYIFNTEEKMPGPKYVKTENKPTMDEDDDFIVGEPLYENSNVNHPNPYAMTEQGQNGGYYGGYVQQSNNYTNPYYQVPQAGNYFGQWGQQGQGQTRKK